MKCEYTFKAQNLKVVFLVEITYFIFAYFTIESGNSGNDIFK